MLLFLEVSSIDYDGNNLVSGDTKGVINIYQPHVQSKANPQGLGIVLFTNQTHQRSVTGIHIVYVICMLASTLIRCNF